jgi:hypothetical protein
MNSESFRVYKYVYSNLTKAKANNYTVWNCLTKHYCALFEKWITEAESEFPEQKEGEQGEEEGELWEDWE